MTATVCCIYANGGVKLLENNSSKSTNAFLAGQWAVERGYEIEMMRTEMARCLGEGGEVV